MAAKASAAKKATAASNHKIEDSAPIQKVATQEVKSARPKIVKLDDSTLIVVKSNVFGELIFVNPRTGDKTKWSYCGDVQPLTMGDLRVMKGTQRAFYENQWIYIVGVEDPGYEDVSPDDIYRTLMVSQYYKNVIDPDNYQEIFSWDADRIRSAVNMMSDGAKMNLAVAANTCIADGSLDSIRKIQVLEDCLGCELVKP